MIFVSLASGSSGNCCFLHTDKTALLIDCGISAKRIAEGLSALGSSIDELDGILLTHEHSDHIKGLKRLMSAYNIPVYASEGTLGALYGATKDEYFRYAGADLMHGVSADRELDIKDAHILPFHIYHDARGPLGFRISSEASAFGDELRRRASVCVATDMGYFDDYIRDHLIGLDGALIEANHDRAMLVGGRYPLYLKRRIMSREGHLCNNQTGKLISEILGPRLRHVFLGHLSKENNTPDLALSTVREEIKEALGERAAEQLSMSVAPHDGPSQILRL